MANVQLANFRNSSDWPDRFEAKPVARVNLESKLGGVGRTLADDFQMLQAFLTAGVAVCPRVKFDDRCTEKFRRFQLVPVGFDKKRNPYTRLTQRANERCEAI